MDSLEQYFVDDYPQDQRDLEDVQVLLAQAVQVYLDRFDKDRLAWPYEARAQAAVRKPDEQLSQSTTSMVLGALLRYVGAFKAPARTEFGEASKASVFPIELDSKIRSALVENVVAASNLLRQSLKEQAARHREKPAQQNPQNDGTTGDELRTDSSTFGPNDVFTLAWLAELARANWAVVDANGKLQPDPSWKAVEDFVGSRAKERLENSRMLQVPSALFDAHEGEAMHHAFPALRLVQILRRLGLKGGALTDYYGYFEGRLHEQLSFSSIPDSRFDPAEMMFCLEGMLLCQRNIVDRTLFDRVFAVLESVQRDSAYWRPVKPYLASRKGSVLFPVSVEVANSLLRACEIFDRHELHATFASRAIKLLRRYFQWLKARAVRFPVNGGYEQSGGDLVGWHSEHVNDPAVIHLWETSQVMEFLMSYRNALHAHIARTTLVRSRFSSKQLKKKTWAELEENFEPVTFLGENLRIYKDIGEQVVNPHEDKTAENYSILLYGPPGTGKTTVAESIAQALERRLITITVSDFLAEGSVQVEARAKIIFDVLMAQPDSVVLFDEIDHFLLDRDSERYTKQDTVFQFMTPGMLTKLNELRRSKRALFVVATNYEDRIDAAIKRPGRIDLKYIVLPPDMAARKRIMVSLLLGSKRDNLAALMAELDGDPQTWDAVCKASVLLGYKDIEALIVSYRTVGVVSAKQMADDLEGRDRTTRLDLYSSRMKRESSSPRVLEPRECPLSEFLYVLALYMEAAEVRQDSPEWEAVKTAKEVMGKIGYEPKDVRKVAPKLPQDWTCRISELFKRVV